MKNFLLNNTNTFISLLNKLSEGIIIHAQDGSIIYTNPAALKILELSEEDILNKGTSYDDWQFIDEKHEKIDSKDYPVNKLLLDGETIKDQIIGLYTSNSTLKWLEINGSITMDKDHNKTALVVFSEITSKKEAYEELELFKNIVDRAKTGITISDPYIEDNPLIYINNTFSKMTGYEKDEVIGKNCRFLQGEDTDQEGIEIVRDSIKEQKSCEVQLKNYTKDGKLFYNLLNVFPIFDKERLKYFVGIQHNITEQKHKEELLKEQNSYIQSILDSQSSIVFVSDKIKIIFSNKTFLNYFKVSNIEEFLSKYQCVCDLFIQNDSYFHLGLLKDDQNWIEELSKLPKKESSCLYKKYKRCSRLL